MQVAVVVDVEVGLATERQLVAELHDGLLADEVHPQPQTGAHAWRPIRLNERDPK